MLVFTMFPAVVSAGGLQGSGTKESPYLVKTKVDLNEVRNNLTAYYRLENDITFTSSDAAFLSIGSSSTGFSGSFEGNGKTITGLKVVSSQAYGTGLFGYVDSGGVVKNLNLKGCSITAEAADDVYVGGIAGSSSGTISNCSFNGTINAKSTWSSTITAAGGIVGRTYGTVTGCSNSGSITANGYRVSVGGVVGKGDSANIVSCSNTGKPNTTSGCCGGIVGSLTDDGKVSKCSNSAALKGSGIAGEVEDGSIVDQSYNTGNLNGGAGIASIINGGTITYCYNSGAITGISVAGIVNIIRGTSVVEYCYNTGNISASNDSYAYAAGIAALIDDNTGDSGCIISNCFNIGTISNTCTKDYYSFTGGIIGHLPENWHEVSNCYNRGSIKYSSYYHGGISGCCDSTVAVENCYYLDSIDHGTNTKDTATKVTDAQMKQQSTFAGFNFTSVWTMAGNANYPYPEFKNMPIVYNLSIGKPVVTAVSSGYNSIKLSWKKVSDANGYEIYRATSSSGTYSKVSTVTSGSAVSYTDKSLATGKTYYYKVRAYRTDSGSKVCGSFSAVVSAKPVPAKPTVTAKSAGYDSIRISWNKISGASGYEVYNATSSSGKYSKSATITSGSTDSYIKKPLTTGKAYYFKVRAYRTVNGTKVYGSFSAAVSAKPVPAKPTVTAKSAGYKSIKLSWGKVSGATAYKIYRATSSGGTYKYVKATSSSSYTDDGLSTGKKYYYKVRAYRTVSGTKVYSSFSTVVSAKPVPAVPDDVKAARASFSSIKVSWSKVSGASGYEVYRAKSKSGTYSKIKTITSGSTVSYTNKSLTAGKKYYYKVRAYRTVNGKKVYGSFSGAASARP